MREIALFDFSKVLVLSPHSDDGGLGAGGTINRMLEEDVEVLYVIFYIDNVYKEECEVAIQHLGVSKESILFYDYVVRHFPSRRQGILDELIELRNVFKPDLVFCPSSFDIHQDHQTIYNETLRAFKTSCSILGYEHPWNNFSISTDVFVQLKERHMIKKTQSLTKYVSQQDQVYMDPQYIRSLARVRGTQVSCPYAETYELLRMVM